MHSCSIDCVSLLAIHQHTRDRVRPSLIAGIDTLRNELNRYRCVNRVRDISSYLPLTCILDFSRLRCEPIRSMGNMGRS